MGVIYWDAVSLSRGYPLPIWSIIFGLEMLILVHSPSLINVCFCSVIRPDLEYACRVWHSRLTVAQSKALEFLQKTASNIIIPGGECATNLIIANVETLSYDDSNFHTFLQMVISLGGMAHWPVLAPLWIHN